MRWNPAALSPLTPILLLAWIGLPRPPGQPEPEEGPITFDLDNKENVVAAALEGSWQAEPRLSQTLSGHVPGKDSLGPWSRRPELAFTLDRAAIPDKVFKKLGNKLKGKLRLTVYAVGRVKGLSGKGTVPFFLTSLHGTPRIVWFRERNKDPFGDAESNNVMLAPAAKDADDLLFLGGDFNNQPFVAYERKG